jgi:hypothetical protein
MELPRETIRDHQEYLFALLQGMTEGTITYDKQRLEAAELELKARQMLRADSNIVNLETTSKLTLDPWQWEPSRHTIQGNTTIVDPSKVTQHTDFVNEQERKGKLPMPPKRRRTKH